MSGYNIKDCLIQISPTLVPVNTFGQNESELKYVNTYTSRTLLTDSYPFY